MILEAVGVAVLGAAVLRSAEAGVRSWEERKGSMHGEWWQYIPPTDDQPAKLDRVACKHRREHIAGKIQRVQPLEESHREWSFRGHVRGSLLITTFLSSNPNDESYGTSLLRPVDGSAQEWSGFYNRLYRAEVNKITVSWLRDRDNATYIWRRKIETSGLED